MRACLLPKPHEFASALKIAQAAVITGPSSVQLAFDRDASVGGLGGLGKQAALVVDQHRLSWMRAPSRVAFEQCGAYG